MLGDSKREEGALIVWIKRGGEAQIFKCALLTAVLHGKKAKFRAWRSPRRLAQGGTLKRGTRLFILPIKHKLSPSNQQCFGRSWYLCFELRKCRLHGGEVVARSLACSAPRKRLAGPIRARKNRRKRLGGTRGII